VTDDLAGWAAERAPELLARAEAEALALLRDALVEAAIRERTRTAADTRPMASTRVTAARDPKPESGDVLWTYCVLRESEPVPDDLEGIAPSAPVERVAAGDLAALVSRVPCAEFGAEPLRENLNDLAWLERVARSHEAVLDHVLGSTTIVPLRLCTIYESEASVRRMLEREQATLIEALDVLAGRQEWGVKLLLDREMLEREARARSPEAATLEDEAGSRSAGGAYMLGRRLERHVREVADSLAAEVAEDVHAHMQDWAIDAVTRPPQNRDLSGHEGEMLLNGSYLVEDHRADALAELAAELEERHRELGAHIELTGPWPPYNFVPGGGTTAIT
jgi:hypothetical protein